MNKNNLDIPKEKIAHFCKRYHILKLSLYGSVIRSDFRNDSDVDVLVEFQPECIPGFIALSKMERELSVIFNKRKIDMRTPQDLSPYFRDEVLSMAEVQYAQA